MGSGLGQHDDEKEKRGAPARTRPSMTAAGFLSGILDEATSDAEAEREAIEARLNQLREEQRLRDERAAEERRLRGEELLQQERERQRRAEARRTIEAQAIRLRREGPIADPDDEDEGLSVAPSPPVRLAVTAEQRAAVRRSRVRVAAAFAALVLLGGGVSAFLYTTAPPLLDPTTYAKTAAPLRQVFASVDAVSVLDIPEPEVPVATPDGATAEEPAASGRGGRGNRGGRGGRGGSNGASASAGGDSGTSGSGSRTPAIQLDTNSGLFNRGGE